MHVSEFVYVSGKISNISTRIKSTRINNNENKRLNNPTLNNFVYDGTPEIITLL